MSVRKRTWTNRDGSQGEAWVVNYTDRGGIRQLKSFERKRDAESFEIAVAGEVRAGTPRPRQPEHHGRRGRPAVARKLRGRRA